MSAASYSQIPVIDLSDSFSASIERRRAVARAMGDACRDTGFFYVSGHGVPEAVVERAVDAAKAFFARPVARKMEVQGPGGGYGYDPAQAQVLDAGTPPDLKEGFMIGMPTNELAAQVCFPGDLPELQAATAAYQSHMIALGRHLMRCLALSLDLDEGYFDAGYVTPDCSVRLLHYAPKPEHAPGDQLGAGAHTDWGAITMLWQDEVGGLQVRDPAGRWISAAPVSGTFVVNLGDMVRRWTNDDYRSTLHRVVSDPAETRHRYSIATFFNPVQDYEVACVPTCRPATGEPRYAPCTVGEQVRMKMRESYGMAG